MPYNRPSSFPRAATTKWKQLSRRGSSRGTQYRLGRHWLLDFSGAGPLEWLRLSQRLCRSWRPRLRQGCQPLPLHRQYLQLQWRRRGRTFGISARDIRTSAPCRPRGRSSRWNSRIACDMCKINKSTKQPIRNKPGKIEITERLQLVSTDLLDSVTPAARGNYHFMAKYSDHCTKFQGGLLHIDKGQGPDDFSQIFARLSHASRTSPPILACRWRWRVSRPTTAATTAEPQRLSSKTASANGAGVRSWMWLSVC